MRGPQGSPCVFPSAVGAGENARVNAIDRSSQKTILFLGALFLLCGLYLAEKCWRTGTWIVEIKQHAYTGGLAVFIILAMIVFGGGFVITSLRALTK